MATLPYGLRDVKIRPITTLAGVDTVGAGIDLPVSQTLSFSETEEFQELRGDDKVQASHGSGATVEWSLEAGGISLQAYAALSGGTLTTTGTGSTLKNVLKKKVTHSRPYFQVEGQSISDSGGDFHTLIYRAKADGSLEGEQTDGAFWLSKASGKGYANANDDVYDFIENATTAAIADPAVPAPVVISTAPTGGTTAGGTTVIITGTSFGGATAVTFGGIAATAIVINTANQITCTSPAAAAGAKAVVVTTPAGASNSTITYLYA